MGFSYTAYLRTHPFRMRILGLLWFHMFRMRILGLLCLRWFLFFAV